MHDLEHRLADASVPPAEHDALLERYSDAAGALPPGRRLRHRPEGGHRAARPRLQPGATSSSSRPPVGRLADAPRAGQAAAAARPDLLLLDEPTNHLDLEARNWLEDYLARYPHAGHPRLARPLLPRRRRRPHRRPVAAHDHRLPLQLLEVPGAARRAAGAAARGQEAAGRGDRRASQEFIDRFRYQATKAAQVQSRIKMLEKVERIEVPPERKRIHFQFPAAAKSGRIGARAEARAQGLRRQGACSTASTCTSSAATASRWSAPTAPASRR